ncbi:unnamed protein product [Symbiodinium sp. CCMP2592]|nr:unnamed protein product [Symbiodinium sp. CCMP2592]
MAMVERLEDDDVAWRRHVLMEIDPYEAEPQSVPKLERSEHDLPSADASGEVDKEERHERREAELQFDSASDDELSPARKPPGSPQKLHAKAQEAPEDVQREQSEATRAESPESLNVESVDDSVHATIEDPAVQDDKEATAPEAPEDAERGAGSCKEEVRTTQPEADGSNAQKQEEMRPIQKMRRVFMQRSRRGSPGANDDKEPHQEAQSDQKSDRATDESEPATVNAEQGGAAANSGPEPEPNGAELESERWQDEGDRDLAEAEEPCADAEGAEHSQGEEGTMEATATQAQELQDEAEGIVPPQVEEPVKEPQPRSENPGSELEASTKAPEAEGFDKPEEPEHTAQPSPTGSAQEPHVATVPKPQPAWRSKSAGPVAKEEPSLGEAAGPGELARRVWRASAAPTRSRSAAPNSEMPGAATGRDLRPRRRDNRRVPRGKKGPRSVSPQHKVEDAPAAGSQLFVYGPWHAAVGRYGVRRAALHSETAEPKGPESPEDALAKSLPFLTDESLIADDISYEGLLATCQGRESYLSAMRDWQQLVPERLEDFKVLRMESWRLNPGVVTARWSIGFVAPLPPSWKLRELPADAPLLPGAKVRVETQLVAEMTLNSEGKVVRHEEAISAGYEILDAIARYELLTARRREADPVTWYWQVLKDTTMEEMAVRSGQMATPEELEWRFNEMVLRNFLYGAALGIAFWFTLKFILSARSP